MNNPTTPSATDSWDTYWQGTRDSAAYTSGGISHPLITAFWDQFFDSVRKTNPSPAIIDVASGSGAVVERAKMAFDGLLPEFTCLDVSAAAVENLQQRYPGVKGVVANALEIPLESAQYDVATSQFGVEYAGIEAIDEIGRLVAPGGRLALMMHYRGGGIYAECSNSLDAIRRTQDANFIPYAIDMFEAGFRAVRGADRADYEAAGNLFTPAIAELDAIFAEYGEHVAGDTIARLYSDVGHIHSEIQHYEPAEVLDWLKRMQGELGAFAGRMESMCECALDAETFTSICAGLRNAGLSIDQSAALTTAVNDPPLAWVLTCTRSDANP